MFDFFLAAHAEEFDLILQAFLDDFGFEIRTQGAFANDVGFHRHFLCFEQGTGADEVLESFELDQAADGEDAEGGALFD